MARQLAKTLNEVEESLQPQKESKEKRDAPKRLFAERGADGLYSIRFTAGGEVPDALKSKWTSIAKAEAAIANYLVSQEQQAQAA